MRWTGNVAHNGGEKMRMRIWLENLRERGQLEDKCRQEDNITMDI
jgi:hypothetical protein